ncbi:cysteine-rich RLK (RECEPTOR-like protein kinase) 3 [Actinidia rufa]|uniref:Cysteine-rich RLK (RECEPTOR-like protein kinase) 3 n=1 Tax=Actinidia rufa TaxID=165716 RepID=A0A7J0FMX1_9ERIC|nr:cysteine-rich RLK (RECEPTOR-like protein kinase) 3 [Actinidia rufa]
MPSPLLYALILSSFCIPLSLSDPRATQAALVCCTNSTVSPLDRQPFVANFLAARGSVASLVSSQRYGGTVNGSGNTTIYAFGECMRDLSRRDCDLCFAQIKIQIIRCLPFQRMVRGGRLFFDGCYMRYDQYNFFNESLSDEDRSVCGSGDFDGDKTLFRKNVMKLVRNLSDQGAKNDGFFVGSLNRRNLSVYGLAQCWEFVNESDCRACLADSVWRIRSCVPKEEGRVLNAGCYVRYSTHKFYYNHSVTDEAAPENGDRRHLAVILGAASASITFVLLVAAISFFMRKKLVKKRRERKQLGALLLTVNKSKLNFSYETLERATNYFHHSNKLGQGGSGSVYKGILQNGEAVAVKRLFYNTTQWVDHFFNEVNLISEIHHKNLVKLLGCSITGPESLLVYEFIPNQSLNDHLFGGRNNAQLLSWEARYKIILYWGRPRAWPIFTRNQIVSGKKNNSFSQNSHSILQMVWTLYGMGKLCEAVDSTLEGKFPEEAANILLQIGLLCVQASAELRPSMSVVVKMLKGNHEISQPTQPPFINSGSAEISQNSGTSSSRPESYTLSSRNTITDRPESYTLSSRNTITESFIEPR